jgi:SAM-dependent methyltransferase
MARTLLRSDLDPVTMPATGARSLTGCIDSPRPGEKISGSFVPITGWAFDPAGVTDVRVRSPHGCVSARPEIKRPDVAKALGDAPGALNTGFYVEVDRSIWSGTAEILGLTADGREERFGHIDASLDDSTFVAAQQRLLEILACPTCHMAIPRQTRSCQSCGREVTWLGDVPSFVGRATNPMARGMPVSSHPALANAARYLDLGMDGLFLDSGAGYPPVSHPKVIQLEIERFPGTNVLADGSELPFADGTFDGAMSHAVLEHVKDPFAYSNELLRVIKPGGRFIVHSAFLVPVHGYPNHYFNTTLEGLKLLFRDAKILEAGVEPFQQPWVMLESILRIYSAGFVDEQERSRFLRMPIGDLLGNEKDDRPLSGFQGLDKRFVEELAAGVYVLGERI